MKIRHITTEGHRVNGNYHRLEDIITKLGTSATLRQSFQAKELGSSDNFVSFLFYNGLVTVAQGGYGRTRLGIPNQTVGEFMHDFIGRAYGDVYGIDSRAFDIANGMYDFAETGDWHNAIGTTCDVVTQYLNTGSLRRASCGSTIQKDRETVSGWIGPLRKSSSVTVSSPTHRAPAVKERLISSLRKQLYHTCDRSGRNQRRLTALAEGRR